MKIRPFLLLEAGAELLDCRACSLEGLLHLGPLLLQRGSGVLERRAKALECLRLLGGLEVGLQLRAVGLEDVRGSLPVGPQLGEIALIVAVGGLVPPFAAWASRLACCVRDHGVVPASAPEGAGHVA